MPIPEIFQGQWIGDLNGTLVGHIYAEFRRVNDHTLVRWSANVRGQPLSLHGEVSEQNGEIRCMLQFVGQPPQQIAAPNTENQNLPPAELPEDPANNAAPPVPGANAFAELIFDNYDSSRLSGRWNAVDGNRGIFQLAGANTAQVPGIAPQESPQIVSRREELPKLRLSRGDLIDLVTAMKGALKTQNDAAIAVNIDGNEIAQFSYSFFSRRDLPKELSFIRLTLTDQAPGIKKNIQITISQQESNVLVSAADDVWVNGAALRIVKAVRRRSSMFSWLFQKHGLNVNGLIFIIMLIFMPELPLVSRGVFVVVAIVGMLVFKYFHSQTSMVRIYPREDTPAPSKIGLGEIAATAIGGAGTVAIVGLFSFLSGGGLSRLGVWLSKFLAAP